MSLLLFLDDSLLNKKIYFAVYNNETKLALTEEEKTLRRIRREQFKDPEYKRLVTNSRERQRQQSLNSAFDELRNVIPTHPKETKLSKYAILKSAIRYIRFLEDLLGAMGPKFCINDDR